MLRGFNKRLQALEAKETVETLLLGVDLALPTGVTISEGETAGFKKVGGIVTGFGRVDRAANQATNAILVNNLPVGWRPPHDDQYVGSIWDLTDYSAHINMCYPTDVGGVIGLEFDGGDGFDGTHHQLHWLSGIVYIPREDV